MYLSEASPLFEKGIGQTGRMKPLTILRVPDFSWCAPAAFCRKKSPPGEPFFVPSSAF
jgi:hypothetical protein